MNLTQALETENSKANTSRIVDYLRANPEHVAALIAIFLGPEARLVQRSAWVVGDLGLVRPELIAPYHAELLAACRAPRHPAVLRNVLRYFAEAETLPEELHGELADIAFERLAEVKTPVAIRVHAMQILARLVRVYPELAGELRALIEDELPRATPGFRSRGRKVLKLLKKLGK